MGGIAKVFSSIFGGGDDSPKTVVQQAPTPAAPAAPATDSAQKETPEDTSVKKKRRGKSGLLVNPLSKNNSGGGTGLNI